MRRRSPGEVGPADRDERRHRCTLILPSRGTDVRVGVLGAWAFQLSCRRSEDHAYQDSAFCPDLGHRSRALCGGARRKGLETLTATGVRDRATLAPPCRGASASMRPWMSTYRPTRLAVDQTVHEPRPAEANGCLPHRRWSRRSHGPRHLKPVRRCRCVGLR